LTVAAAEPTGDPVLVWRAATNLGVRADDAVPAIEAGLVETGIRVSFRHPLARSAAYAGAALADRQVAHRELAQVTDRDLDPDRRAWHAALGSPGPDEAIADALEQSAERARARGGLAAAAALLERSVVLSLDPLRRRKCILASAAAHLEAGSFDRCASMLTAAEATNLDDMGRAEVDLLRARHAVFSGAIRDAPDLLLRAARRLEPLDTGRAAEAYLAAQAAASVAGTSAGGATIRDVAQAALRCPMPAVRTTREWLVTGLAQVVIDGPGAAASALRQALDVVPGDATAGQAIHWLGYQAGAALVLWDINDAHNLAGLHVDRTRQLGALTMLPVALNTLAHIYVLEGDLGAAATSLAEAQPIIEATQSSILPHGGAILAGWGGGPDALGTLNELVERAGREGNDFARMSAQCASAIWCNGMGRYEEAVAVATRVDSEQWAWSAHTLFHELIEAAARTGKSAVASHTLERLNEAAETSATDWAIGVALLSEGSAAEERYREAIDRLGRTKIRPQLARAHLLYGEWLRREKQQAAARTHLRTAYEMFTSMGIHAFAQRTRRELLATGETRRKRSTDSFDELTPQEVSIARLAATGHTNPEIGAQLFISPRTVEFHLRKVFTKLHISSRRQLRDAMPPSTRRTPLD
jgi:tetratricopeptide (TPR) repeat protein